MCIVSYFLCLVRCYAKDFEISTKLMQQKSPLCFNILRRNPIRHYNIHRDKGWGGGIIHNRNILILAVGDIPLISNSPWSLFAQ